MWVKIPKLVRLKLKSTQLFNKRAITEELVATFFETSTIEIKFDSNGTKVSQSTLYQNFNLPSGAVLLRNFVHKLLVLSAKGRCVCGYCVVLYFGRLVLFIILQHRLMTSYTNTSISKRPGSKWVITMLSQNTVVKQQYMHIFCCVSSG